MSNRKKAVLFCAAGLLAAAFVFWLRDYPISGTERTVVGPLINELGLPDGLTKCSSDRNCQAKTYMCCCDIERGAINKRKSAEYDKIIAGRPKCDLCMAVVCPRPKEGSLAPVCVDSHCWLAQVSSGPAVNGGR